MLKNRLLNKGELSKRLLELEVFTFFDAIELVKNLPYGRTLDRANPNLVVKELKGTCSTKHALLKKVALEQGFSNVKLYLCLFKMNSSNTPKLVKILEKYKLSYIPEAHCILKIDDYFVDVTKRNSNYDSLKDDVLEMLEIQPEQIGGYKVNYHQQYLLNWLPKQELPYTFEHFWEIREQCIKTLSV